jgi:hypothetical protein
MVIRMPDDITAVELSMFQQNGEAALSGSLANNCRRRLLLRPARLKRTYSYTDSGQMELSMFQPLIERSRLPALWF